MKNLENKIKRNGKKLVISFFMITLIFLIITDILMVTWVNPILQVKINQIFSSLLIFQINIDEALIIFYSSIIWIFILVMGNAFFLIQVYTYGIGFLIQLKMVEYNE